MLLLLTAKVSKITDGGASLANGASLPIFLYVFRAATPAEIGTCSESQTPWLQMNVFSYLREQEQRNRLLFVQRLLRTFQRIVTKVILYEQLGTVLLYSWFLTRSYFSLC